MLNIYTIHPVFLCDGIQAITLGQPVLQCSMMREENWAVWVIHRFVYWGRPSRSQALALVIDRFLSMLDMHARKKVGQVKHRPRTQYGKWIARVQAEEVDARDSAQ